MRLTVAYHPSALDDLTTIWLTAPDPEAVRQASDSIDRLLKVDADRIGLDLGDYRQLRVEPLEVEYRVSLADCYVEVFRVRFVG